MGRGLRPATMVVAVVVVVSVAVRRPCRLSSPNWTNCSDCTRSEVTTVYGKS